ESARALGASAAAHLETAGRRALDHGDTTAAVNLLERAGLLLPTQQVEPALEEGLIRGLGMSGRLSEAIARADRAAALCASVGNDVGEMRARLAGAVWRENVDPAANEQLLIEMVERARPLIESSGDEGALASLEFAAGYIEHYNCRFGDSFVLITRCMEYATLAHDLSLASSARAVAGAAVSLGPMPADEAQRWLDTEQTAEGGGFTPLLDVWRAWLLGVRGYFDEARSLFTATLDHMNERGLRTGAAIAMQAGWQIETLAGDLEAAEHMARLGCDQLEQLGERAWLSTQECQLGEALYALGRYEEAEQRVLRGLDFGGAGDVSTQLLALQVRAKVSARRGDHPTALSLAQEAIRLAATTQAPLLAGDAVLVLAEVLHLAGSVALADEEVERAIEHYRGKGAVASVGEARRLAATWGNA
ncbi:MAG: hypothetical protein QOE18_73, partial [Chloroflexota bacterium]|nr:hypothetical protein [Chloroflexota bacterium]